MGSLQWQSAYCYGGAESGNVNCQLGRDIELEMFNVLHCFVYLLIAPGPRGVRQNAQLKGLVGQEFEISL